MPSEIVGPQVHFVEARSWREDTHVWWKACDHFLRRTGAQKSPCPLHTAAQPRLTLQARITGSQYFASGKTAEAKLIDQNLLRYLQEIGTVHSVGVKHTCWPGQIFLHEERHDVRRRPIGHHSRESTWLAWRPSGAHLLFNSTQH